MKTQKVLFSMGILALFLVLAFTSDLTYQYMRVLVGRTFKHIGLEGFICSLTLFVFGLFLGTFHLTNEIKKPGSWRVDFEKIIVLGIPTFLMTTYANIIMIGVERHWSFNIPVLTRYLSGGGLIFQYTTIFLGFIITNSLIKKENK